jgi:hypothetical protein
MHPNATVYDSIGSRHENRMPSDAHIQMATQIRAEAARSGAFPQRRASQLVELFGVDYTPEGIEQVKAALEHVGLATKVPLSADKPKRQTIVVIVGGGATGAPARVEAIEIWAGKPDREYRVLAPLQARVTAATIVSKTPTMEDVNLKLREAAARLGANAVINVTYSRGVSASSWKALTAKGTGVVLEAAPVSHADESRTSSDDPLERIRELAELRDAGAITEQEYASAKAKLLDAI